MPCRACVFFAQREFICQSLLMHIWWKAASTVVKSLDWDDVLSTFSPIWNHCRGRISNKSLLSVRPPSVVGGAMYCNCIIEFKTSEDHRFWKWHLVQWMTCCVPCCPMSVDDILPIVNCVTGDWRIAGYSKWKLWDPLGVFSISFPLSYIGTLHVVCPSTSFVFLIFLGHL